MNSGPYPNLATSVVRPRRDVPHTISSCFESLFPLGTSFWCWHWVESPVVWRIYVLWSSRSLRASWIHFFMRQCGGVKHAWPEGRRQAARRVWKFPVSWTKKFWEKSKRTDALNRNYYMWEIPEQFRIDKQETELVQVHEQLWNLLKKPHNMEVRWLKWLVWPYSLTCVK